MLVTSVMVIFAMPAVMLARSLLIMDRLVGTHFFDPAGEDPLLWQHLSWFFGHPEDGLNFLATVGAVTITASFLLLVTSLRTDRFIATLSMIFAALCALFVVFSTPAGLILDARDRL